MWIIIKFKQNQFYTLKQEFKKKLEIEPNFFFPKLKLQKIKKNKLISYVSPLLGDYIFCFHPKFSNENILRNVNYLKGVKFLLNGFRNYQKDIPKSQLKQWLFRFHLHSLLMRILEKPKLARKKIVYIRN